MLFPRCRISGHLAGATLLTAVLLALCSQSVRAEGGDAPVVAPSPNKAPAPGVLPQPESASPVSGPAKYRLQYHFKTNDRVYFRVTHAMTIVTRKGEASETAKNESKTTKHYRVFSVDAEGNGLLELVIDRVQMTAQFGGNTPISVDSSDPENVPRAYRSVVETVGRPLARIKVSPEGKLLSAQRVLDSGLQRKVTTGTVSSTDNDADPSRNFLVVFPEREIAVGESWTDRSLTVKVRVGRALSRPVQLLRTYTLESVKDEIATITLKTAVITPVNDPALQAQLIQRTPSGTIEFDLQAGRIAARTMRIDDSVIGPFGDNSSLKATSLRTETQIDRPVLEARRGAGPANLPEVKQ